MSSKKPVRADAFNEKSPRFNPNTKKSNSK